MSNRSSSAWAKVAGVLLILDGLVVAMIGITIILVFQPVGAVEGRVYVDQTPYALMIVPVLLGLAYFWAGQRAIRGIRAGRSVGILLAVLPAAVFGSLLLGSGMSLGELAFAAGVVGAQVIIIVALLRWSAEGAARA